MRDLETLARAPFLLDASALILGSCSRELRSRGPASTLRAGSWQRAGGASQPRF